MIENKLKKKLPHETSILLVLIGIAIVFELVSWVVRDRTFLFNFNRMFLMVLQISIIGIIAVGVTQVIITTGIDLSSGSVLAFTAVVCAAFAQSATASNAFYPSLLDLSPVIPILIGLSLGILCGLLNGILVAKTAIPPFIATLGMMLMARGGAQWFTNGEPVNELSESFLAIGDGYNPLIIFLVTVAIFHFIMNKTKYGRYIYAIGGNINAAWVSGIPVNKYLIAVYTIAGGLSGLAGVVITSRVGAGQSGMGLAYELDAIAAAVIGGTSLMGGVGRITGTLIGACMLGLIKSGFTFLGVNSYAQEVVKGIIIIVAVILDMRKNKSKK